MIPHHPTHWIAVALIAGLALLAFEASGQAAMGATGASAMFEGRPALAGAQGGLGAQAGVPQGGIGVQGSEVAERSLRAPRVIEEWREQKEREKELARKLEEAPDPVVAANNTDMVLVPRP